MPGTSQGGKSARHFSIRSAQDLERVAVGARGVILLPAWRPWYAKPGFIGRVDAFVMRLAKGLLAQVPEGKVAPELAKVHQAVLEVVWNALIHGTRFSEDANQHVTIHWVVAQDQFTVWVEDTGREPVGTAPPVFELGSVKTGLMQHLRAMEVTHKGLGEFGMSVWTSWNDRTSAGY